MTFAFNEDLTYAWYQLVNLLDTEITESGTYYAQGDSCHFHATMRDEPIDEHYTRWYSLSQNQNFLTLQYDNGEEIYDMNFNRIIAQ